MIINLFNKESRKVKTLIEGSDQSRCFYTLLITWPVVKMSKKQAMQFSPLIFHIYLQFSIPSVFSDFNASRFEDFKVFSCVNHPGVEIGVQTKLLAVTIPQGGQRHSVRHVEHRQRLGANPHSTISAEMKSWL